MPNLRIIDLPSGSINGNEITYISDAVSGSLNYVSMNQVKDFVQDGINIDLGSFLLTSSYQQDSSSFNEQIANVETDYLSRDSFDSFSISIADIIAGLLSNVLPIGHFLVGNALGTASDAGSGITWGGQSLTINTGFIGVNIDDFDISFGSPSNMVLGYNRNTDRVGFFTGDVQYMFTNYGTPVFPNLSSSVGTTASVFPLVIDSYGNITYNEWQSGSGGGGNVNSGSLVSTSSFDAFTSSFYSFSGSVYTLVNNVYASESSYLTTSSFNNFSSSYLTTSASLVNILNEITASGGGVSFIEFNAFTASLNSYLSNKYASESNYTLTSSFSSFQAKYQADSSSFLSLIFGITGSSGSGVNISAFNAFTASTDTNINTLTTAGTFNFIVGDGQSFTPSASSTVFSSSLLINRSIVMFCEESFQLAPFPRSGITNYSFTSSMGIIHVNNGEFDSGSYYYIQYK